MARLATYTKDENLNSGDTLIGTEFGTNRTINIPLSAINSYVDDTDSSLTQAGIVEAITDNPAFRTSIGIVTLLLAEFDALVAVGTDVEGGIQSTVFYNITDD